MGNVVRLIYESLLPRRYWEPVFVGQNIKTAEY